jgi:precorrin-6B methylase 1
MLEQGVERARRAAGELSEASEDAALARFRQALLPGWDRRDEIAAACESNAEQVRALDVIERLRYAEERAVRREVSELAPLRRKVEALRTSPPKP